MEVLRSRYGLSVLGVVGVVMACASPGSQPQSADRDALEPHRSSKAGTSSGGGRGNELGAAVTRTSGANGRERSAIGATYDRHLKSYRDATYAKVVQETGAAPPADATLTFDPRGVQYFDRISKELQLTPQELGMYGKHGMAAVDHGQRYSMGSAYFAIYARDLPVLITTDSVAHALHRSYDDILKQLEYQLFLPALDQALRSAHDTLASHAGELGSGPLDKSAADVDLYLTVAQSLLSGWGAQPGTTPEPQREPKPVASRFGQDAKVKEILALVAALKLQEPHQPTALYGGRRPIDYSQFRPRGHYTESEELKRYFRAMMWLGRADTAFVIQPPSPKSSLEIDSKREARSAALMAMVMGESGASKSLGQLRAIIDFMVGRSDNATLDDLQGAMDALGLKMPAELADDAALDKLRNAIGALATQQIRSQVSTSPARGTEKIAPPQIFQVFGQSFVIDSFALSKVVFDEIVFKDQKQQRMMPSGLDVMAALGNNEAVRLLKPELEKWNYGANLLAAHKTIAQRPAGDWSSDLYNLWLDALRELDESPEGHLPQVMRREPWRRKQLQTQLASWSELRHDTLLYAKQSYSAYPSCGYPAAFVEPYPAFFTKLERFATSAADLIAAANLAAPAPGPARYAAQVREGIVKYLQTFGEHMKLLAGLASKELAAKPFTPEEQNYLRQTIDRSGGGSGPPRYDGWYPRLIYGQDPDAWKPTIADVHTDPLSQKALEVGVGDVSFMVVAIDNENERAAYVGPIYTYYEFAHPVSDRLTDEKWRAMLMANEPPAPPAFTRPFRSKPVPRQLGPALPRTQRDPRAKELQDLSRRFSRSTNKNDRARLFAKIQKLRQELATVPVPKP